MPSDIDPQSGFRLPLPQARGFGRGSASAPTTAPIRRARPSSACAARPAFTSTAPRPSRRTPRINHYLRHEAGFDPKLREVAILTVAREMDSRFEWAAHEPEALQVGVPQDVVDVIKYRKSTAGLSEARRRDHRIRPPGGRQAQGDVRSLRAAESSVRAEQAGRSRSADGQLRRHRDPARGFRHAGCRRAASRMLPVTRVMRCDRTRNPDQRCTASRCTASGKHIILLIQPQLAPARLDGGRCPPPSATPSAENARRRNPDRGRSRD